MPLPAIERAALRNTAAISLTFTLLRLLKMLAPRRKKPSTNPIKPVDWKEEMWRSAAAGGLTMEVHGRSRDLLGPHAAGILSLAPLRQLCAAPGYYFNYRFVVCYLLSQIVVSLLPKYMKDRPMLLSPFSAAMLLSSWILSDECLPQMYIKFLYTQGRSTLENVHTLRKRILEGKPLKETLPCMFPKPQGGTWTDETGTDFKGLLHAAAKYFAEHMSITLPFYTKVYGLRAFVLLLRKVGVGGVASLLTVDPAPMMSTTIPLAALDVVRSSSFLSLYCTSAWLSLSLVACGMPDTKSSPAILWLCLLVPGLALLVESPSQQRTIGNYCTTFALYPLLAQFGQLGFDAAGVSSALLCSHGIAKRPFLLNLLWAQ
ncbi:hypothetical protein DIPPA_12031 [Diplonema papillatum]|nr:hypothetical protein DIPPA_12031 [Diplonema papillatum]